MLKTSYTYLCNHMQTFVILFLWVISFDKVVVAATGCHITSLLEITKNCGGHGPPGPSHATALWKKCDLRQPFWLKVVHNLDASVRRMVSSTVRVYSISSSLKYSLCARSVD